MKKIWEKLKKALLVSPGIFENQDITRKKVSEKNGTPIEKKYLVSVSDFRHGLNIEIYRSSCDEMVIELQGIDLSLINSLRRILLSETMTLAIHKVFFYDNSSILNDEFIAHRLGLVPINFPPDLIDFFSKKNLKEDQRLIFELKLAHPGKFVKRISIFSNSLKWKSYGLIGSFVKNSSVNPVFRDILILKLNPGQKINCECHCILGIGTMHSKFSPVGTVFYRIFPKIKIINEITGKKAEKFFRKCPVRVFDVEEIPKIPLKKLIVSSPRFCTFCKECLPSGSSKIPFIRLGRLKNKVSFVIESTGVLSPEILFHRAVFLLVGKCNDALANLYENFSPIKSRYQGSN